MEPMLPTEGEFHHFQLVNSEGEVPLSISVLVHINPKSLSTGSSLENPISADDVLAFHEELKAFDGDFSAAFTK